MFYFISYKHLVYIYFFIVVEKLGGNEFGWFIVNDMKILIIQTVSMISDE